MKNRTWNTRKTGTGNRNSFGFCCLNVLRGYENILDPKIAAYYKASPSVSYFKEKYRDYSQDYKVKRKYGL